jgi:hypothetical protein
MRLSSNGSGQGQTEHPTSQDAVQRGRGMLSAVSGMREVLEIGLVCVYIVAMLSLDFYWAAVKPQNFGFFVIMAFGSWALNKFRFDSNKAYKHEPPPPLLPQPWVRPYANFMGFISVIMPWALLLSGENFYKRLFAMAPHLYLVMAQVFLESVGSRLRWAGNEIPACQRNEFECLCLPACHSRTLSRARAPPLPPPPSNQKHAPSPDMAQSHRVIRM